MQPTYISINTLFSAQRRYTVPLFQRPYVWGLEAQWEPLWQDIEGLLERMMVAREGHPVPGHFLGTIVLEQAQTSVADLERREVIDGQQRLTTLQLVLKAAEHALHSVAEAASETDRPAIKLEEQRLLNLTGNLALNEERFKVWPTNEDRSSFADVMGRDAASGAGLHGSRMAEAYRYFRQTFLAWLSGAELPRRAALFSSALRDHLRIIVLDLDDHDEPQAIFETLNAHGTPLLPADLIKNWLLWEAARQQVAGLSLYQDYWQDFDKDHAYWRAEIGTGHAARARIDTFLVNWLTRKTRENVPAKHLYDRFLRYTRALAVQQHDGRVHVADLMADIAADAGRYRAIDECAAKGRFGTFLQRLKTLEILVFHPVVMELMDRAEADPVMLEGACGQLESFLIRRMICGFQTRGYGNLAIALLERLAVVEPSGFDQAVAGVLTDGGRDGGYPPDAVFAHEWRNRRFYGGLRRDRVAMILQALEEGLQARLKFAEPVLAIDFSQLQIEHVMPRSWQQHWPVTPEKAAARDAIVHSIGNLTLVSGALNPSLSNAAWLANGEGSPGKREALAAHSKLELNARLIADNQQAWDEERIGKRADKLFELARSLWPIPALSQPSD